MPTRRLSVAAAVFVLIAAAFPACAENCSEILQFAGEKFAAKTSADKATSVVSWFCSRSFESEGEARSAAAAVSFPIEGLMIGASLSGSGNSFKQKQQEFCSSDSLRERIVTSLTVDVSSINPVIAQAVATCVGRRSTGIWLSLESSLDPKAFKVHVESRGLGFGAELLNLALAPEEGVRCTPVLPSGFKVTGAGLELLCQRTEASTPVTVSINFKEVQASWDTSSTLPAAQVWKPMPLPACNPGGAGFVFPNGHSVAGTLETTAVIQNATKCSIDFVEFSYDCAWPDAGPSWKPFPFAKSPPERSLGPDVTVRAHLPLDGLIDGRNNAVQPGALCQILANVRYSNGLIVPNFTSFRYLRP